MHLGVVVREEVVSAAEYDSVATLLTEGAQMNHLVVHTVLTILTLRQYRGPVPNGGKQTL